MVHNKTQELLDRYIEIVFHSRDLFDKGSSKEENDYVDSLLSERENNLLEHLKIDINEASDYSKFDHMLNLIDRYRNEESAYEELLKYVTEITR